jgi:murein DD-endopeptidase MepM/ murein hydrolase activator NlpD
MAFQERASARRLGVGTEVSLRYRTSDGWLRGVDVSLNADSTVSLSRGEFGWSSAIAVTPLWADTLFLAGPIDGSLWNAVVDHPALEGVSPADRASLMWHLQRVYEYQIDFSRQIQPGDYYRFAFERRMRPDGTMHSSGAIVAAELVNSGKSFHAIRFAADEGGQASYYDLDGNSLRRFFLVSPVEFRYISSRFSTARRHPILGTWRAHRGVDYAASQGTPVRATGDGVIVTRGRSGNYGNLVEIRHPNGYNTRYAHLRGFASGQATGRPVKQGDVIGFVGMTGLATGPHLHYEMIQRGQHIDPLNLNLPTGDPVPAHALDRWSSAMVQQLALLELLPGSENVRFASHVAGARPDSVLSANARP